MKKILKKIVDNSLFLSAILLLFTLITSLFSVYRSRQSQRQINALEAQVYAVAAEESEIKKGINERMQHNFRVDTVKIKIGIDYEDIYDRDLPFSFLHRINDIAYDVVLQIQQHDTEKVVQSENYFMPEIIIAQRTEWDNTDDITITADGYFITIADKHSGHSYTTGYFDKFDWVIFNKIISQSLYSAFQRNQHILYDSTLLIKNSLTDYLSKVISDSDEQEDSRRVVDE